LSTLLVVLPCLLLRKITQQAINRPRSRRKPTIEPMTIPAIAPPLNLEPPWEAELVPVPVDVEPLEVDVCDDNRFEIVEKTGNVTPSHFPVVFEVTQHESVAFSELALQ
jgi:hypothetical protein